MAEYTSLQAPASEFKMPPLPVIGVGVVILAAAVYLISKHGGSSGGTTAAATSINAALGSLQEQQMNLLGTVQSGQQASSTAFGGLSTQVQNTQDFLAKAISDQGTLVTQTIQSQADLINQNMNSNNAGVLSAIADALGKMLAGQQAITSVVQGGNAQIIGQIQTSEANTLNTITPQIAQLTSLVNSGNSANSAQVTALSNSITQSLAAEQANFSQSIAGLNVQNQQLANFLNWQFYQLPNRYSAYIPAGVTA